MRSRSIIRLCMWTMQNACAASPVAHLHACSACIHPAATLVISQQPVADCADSSACAVKTYIIHYKLLNDVALDRGSFPAGHESQLEALLCNLIGEHGEYWPCLLLLHQSCCTASLWQPALLVKMHCRAHSCWC